MKNILLLFLFLVPVFLFAQYPTQGNKSRLGYQTTGDGLIWRGVAADTSYKPIGLNYPYFQLDTVNGIFRRYIRTRGRWQEIGGGTDIDSLIYATRYWVSTNFFPIEGGTLTGTGGAGFIGFPSQVTASGTPASGLNVYAQGSSFNWKGTDGYERQITSTLTGGHSYDLPNINGTFALGTGTTDRSARWSATNTLAAGNFTDNGTKIEALLPFQFQSWTTAGRPTGVNGYTGFNTSFNWLDIYLSTGWFSPLQSSLTGGLGTAGRVLYTDANGRATDSGNLTYTGTRFQTGGSIRIGYNNASNDTASIEKVIDVNSKIIRFNAPGGPGNFGGGFVFRGGQNGTINTANTFRIYAPGTTASGSVFVGNVTEPAAQAGNPSTIFGILNKITSTTAFDAAINIHPNETGAGANYSLALGKQYGILIGNQYANTAFQNFATAGVFGVFIGYQRQPLTSGHGSSMVLSAHGEGASTTTEVMRLQGKDGNICLGCTNAQYQLYTSNTGAYGIPRGNTGERPTWVSATSPLRWNTDTSAIEVGIGVGSWVQFATRAYARSLFGAISITNIGNSDLSLTGNRTLHGAGYTLRFNANTIFRDSLKIGNLIEPSDADSIVITKSGWIGKQKFLLKNYRDSIYKYNGNGFFSDKFASGFKSSRNRFSNLFYADTTGFMQMATRDSFSNLLSAVYVGINNSNRFVTMRVTRSGTLHDFALGSRGIDYSSSVYANIFSVDSSGTAIMVGYGGGVAKTLNALGKTLRSPLGVATDGTFVNIEAKRDTTIYVTDSDYNFAAAITSAQVLARYNRIIIYSKLSSGATSDNQIFLHSASSDFLQCEIIIYSNDASADADATSIDFTTNGAVDGAGGTVSSYGMSAGQRVNIRAVDDGGYKWFFN